MTVWANPVADKVAELATCLCAAIADAELPEPCFCGVLPGETVIYEYAEGCDNGPCGMAWVRLTQVYPAQSIGAPSIVEGNCGAMTGFDVEIGIVRCVEGMDAQGNPPSSEAQLAASQLQADDAMAMRRAIVCCTGSKDFLLGAYLPIGPDGGLVGGTWNVSIMV